MVDQINSKQFLDSSLRVIGGKKLIGDGLTLTAIMHNEIYFLPDFLAHYRNLGVERFVIIDDCSSDGSREFAFEQPDVVIMESDHRYGDMIRDPRSGKMRRAMLAWRNSLLEQFGRNRWSLHLDIDEFIELPNGLRFQEFLAQFPAEPSLIWGVMIDLYPRNWSDIIQDPPPKISEVTWYFDGRAHLRLAKNLKFRPSIVYSGARARLRDNFVSKQAPESLRRRFRRVLNGNPYPYMGAHYKPALLYWRPDFYFKSSHQIGRANAQNVVLPISHFKFAPNFISRFEHAIQSGAMNNGSRGYKTLKELYEAMQSQGKGFLFENSQPFDGYRGYYKNGITIGLDSDALLDN